MTAFWQDVRFALRLLLKSPGFTLVAIITLGLGIGLNSAVFSGVSAFVLRPLPVENADRIVVPMEVQMNEGGANDFSYPDYVDYREQSGVFEGLLAHTLVEAALSQSNQNDVIYGEIVSGNYFDVLRVRPNLGRGFNPDEDKEPGTHPVVVLSHILWERRFASDPNIVGRTVQLNGQSFAVVGVAPENFRGTKWGLSMDFWVPLMMQEQITRSPAQLNSRASHWIQLMGRLKDGVTLDEAAAAMTTVSKRLEQAYPEERNHDVRVVVLPETRGRFDSESGAVTFSTGLAMGAVGLILLIACANVANLLLARSVERRKEIGIRLALGASRLRLIRQLLTESVLLSSLGGLLGLLLAFWATDLMWSLVPILPYNFDPNLFSIDKRALIFTVVISIATGIIFGLAPALQASNPDVVPVLKGDSSLPHQGFRRFTLRNLLVVAQVALSLVVLVCAGLFVKSVRNAERIDPGIKTDNVMLMSVNPGLLGYSETEGLAFYRQLIERVEALPGVETASVASIVQLGDSSNSTGPVRAEEQAPPAPGKGGGGVMVNVVSPNHLKTLQIPLLAGRDFTERDDANSTPVIIINETLARKLWPGENPIGKRLRIGRNEKRPPREVVGVAKDGKYRTLGESPTPYMYLPHAQSYEGGMTLMIRTSNDPRNIVSAVRQVTMQLDTRLPLYRIMTLKEHVGYALMFPRMGAKLAITFGLLAMLLAATGIYSVMAYSVSQRTKEIGIRMALGAQRSDVLRLITVQGMTLALLGIIIGLAIAFASSRIFASFLYGVSATDLATFTGVAGLLSLIAFIACFIPARRATRVDPMVALRYE